MRATVGIVVTDDKLVTGAVAEPYTATAYDSGTAYAFGDIRSVAADFAIYEYLQPYDSGVTGKTPKSSPYYWRKIGPTETAYDPGKTDYAAGETCSANHRVYESRVTQEAANPLPVLPETETEFWMDIGPTMRYAMFDLSRNTQTVGPSPLTAVVQPGVRFNTAGLTGMKGNTLLIKVTSASVGGIIYPLAYSPSRVYAKNECMTVGLTTCYKCKVEGTTGISAPNATYWEEVDGAIFDLNTRQVFDAYSYYFTPFATRPTKVALNIPPVSDAVITVTLTADSGNCKIGGLTIGTNMYMGTFLKPARNKMRSFSKVERDLYGNATLVKRRNIPTLEGQILIPSDRVDFVMDARSLLDAEPALFTGVDTDGDYTNFATILGICQRFDIETTEGADALGDFLAEEI